jgi:hypothetical protein
MRILNIGSGPVEHGKYPGIDIACCDRRGHAGAIIEDMENLTYPDKFFDLVVCINALDHTKDAQRAVYELIRVSKGWVYIDCAMIQKTASGKGHYWDMIEDGTMKKDGYSFNLRNLGFEIEFVDNGMERRYNHIVARYSV